MKSSDKENFCLESLTDDRSREDKADPETGTEVLVRQESSSSSFSNSSWCEEAEQSHTWDMQSVNSTLYTLHTVPCWGHDDFLNPLTDLVSRGPAVLDLPTSPPTEFGTGEECLTWRPPTGRDGKEGTGLRDDKIWLIHLLDKYGLHSINVWIHHFPIHLKH